jgi:preprotein translocase subunit YajC
MFITNIYANDENVIALQEEVIETEPEIFSPQGWTMLVPAALMLVIFYFLLLRPQEKKRKAHDSLIKGVKKGESVVTSSGIYGIVTNVIDENTVEVEIAKDVEIKILKTAIIEITSRSKEQKKEQKQPQKTIKGKKGAKSH